MPKAQLLADGELHFQYQLAKELGMTHRRLLVELGTGETAYWRGVFELENEHFEQSRRNAEHQAEVDEKMRKLKFR